MNVGENKKFVTDFLASLSKGNLEAVAAALAENATWWVAGNFPLSGTKTKRELLQLLGNVRELMPEGLTVTPQGITAEGDRVAVEAESYGKTVKGKVYQNKYHFLFEVQGGKIQAVKEYMDTMHANEVFCQ